MDPELTLKYLEINLNKWRSARLIRINCTLQPVEVHLFNINIHCISRVGVSICFHYLFAFFQEIKNIERNILENLYRVLVVYFFGRILVKSQLVLGNNFMIKNMYNKLMQPDLKYQLRFAWKLVQFRAK
jgi:hypothetical protein